MQPNDPQDGAITPETSVKRGRGRPRKHPVPETPAVKRPRGRPRKNPVDAAPAVDPAPKLAPAPKDPASPRRGRAQKVDSAPEAPVAVDSDLPTPTWRGRTTEAETDPVADAPKAPRRRPRREVSAPTESAPFAYVGEGEDLPMPTFRAAGTAPPGEPDDEDENGDDAGNWDRDRESGEEVTDGTIPRTSRRTRGRTVGREDVPAARVPTRRRPEAPSPKLPTVEPKKPVREPVRIPADAPQVIIREGIPTLVRAGRAFAPLFFFGNPMDERRLDTVMEQVRYAADAGVEVFVFNVDIPVSRRRSAEDAIAFAGFVLRRALEIAPGAQVLFRTVFTADSGWDRSYPKARYFAESGGLGEPSLCEDTFWADAEACLIDFVRGIRTLDPSGNVIGVHLERGEWFFAAGWGYDTSPAAQDAFRAWARVRYRNDNVALCASWFDGQVQFETLTVPDYRTQGHEGFIQTGRKSRRWVDYHLFLSDITVQRIAQLAYSAKIASEGRFLVGVSYGYTFEWSHPASGHLSLGKLLRTPEVDFIAGPPSYRDREPGGTCPFPGPVDSFALNGKLYISEEDFKTPISGGTEPDDFNPVMKTPQALETVHWRGLGAALAHAAGVCWMDLWGNGWLKSSGIWERGEASRHALIRRMSTPQQDPEVAVFVDERSLAYLADPKAFDLLVQQVRESVLRSGLSAGFYLLSDLAHREHFPEAKLYVFLNAWDLQANVRSAIKTRLQRDGKHLFWLYTAGLFDGGRDALERVREVTGIALKRQPFASRSGTTLLNKKHPLAEALSDAVLNQNTDLEISYFAIPEDGVVLGEYTQTGLPSFLVREIRSEGTEWTSIFLGEPVVTPALFRALGLRAGCHVWNYQEDLVHVRLPFVTVHARGPGNRTLTLPEKCQAYLMNRGEWLGQDGSQVRLHAPDGATVAFLVGKRAEIDSLLAAPTEEILRVPVLPDREDNTLDADAMNFDVPIMRLDSWVEETWSEEAADDLLIKPSEFPELESFDTAEVDAARDDHGGRRRGRRRRNPRDRKGGRDSGSPSSDFDVTEMSVVFRKRD